jgi:hypothetical protein
MDPSRDKGVRVPRYLMGEQFKSLVGKYYEKKFSAMVSQESLAGDMARFAKGMNSVDFRTGRHAPEMATARG